MWKLKLPAEELKEWYKKLMLEGLRDRIMDGRLSRAVREILIPVDNRGIEDLSNLEHLLTDEPVALKKLNDKLMSRIISVSTRGRSSYNDGEFEALLKARAKRAKNAEETKLCRRYEILEELRRVFDYDNQLGQNKSRAYRLTLEQGHNTCTYCNRSYVFTVVRDKGKNDGNRIARPVLDHWYSKELFPLMSLSLCNLIPCCSVCNSSAKGSAIFRAATHVHPYIATTPTEPGFKFRYKALPGGRWTVVIDPSSDPKENRMAEEFKLEDMYSYHGELEVKDILEWKYQNNDVYLSQVLNGILAHYKMSKADVYRMFFGTEPEPLNNLKRPLSKLKRDVLRQVGLIDQKGEWK